MDRTEIGQILERQRKSFLTDAFPSAAVRQDRLDRLYDLLKVNQKALCEAMNEDFGARATFHSTVSDILVTLDSIKYCRKHTAGWMQPENRGAKFPLNWLGAKAQVFYQPKGVVGIVSPWNFPVQLTFSPLTNVLSAGNRAMIKPSELTPVTSALIKTLVEDYFSAEEVAVVTGGVETGVAFTEQPFDHLVFTGAPSVAKYVAHAAAENLVPLTLELGGKCPVIIADDANIASAVERLMTIKVLNAGQICLAPDYIFIKESLMEAFIDAVKRYIASSFSRFNDNDDYASIINERNYNRLQSYVDEAKTQGCRVIELSSASNDQASVQQKKFPPTLLIDPPDDLKVMENEIFGPILPIKTYSAIEDVVEYINQRPRPLALYFFGHNAAEIKLLKETTVSGGMVVNDVLAHVLQDTMPLGGVGYSGMGSYHGLDGFKEFSHAKAYFKQGLVSLTPLFKPPYKNSLLKIIKKFMG